MVPTKYLYCMRAYCHQADDGRSLLLLCYVVDRQIDILQMCVGNFDLACLLPSTSPGSLFFQLALSIVDLEQFQTSYYYYHYHYSYDEPSHGMNETRTKRTIGQFLLYFGLVR